MTSHDVTCYQSIVQQLPHSLVLSLHQSGIYKTQTHAKAPVVMLKTDGEFYDDLKHLKYVPQISNCYPIG